jgi:hypothetical protein
MTDEEREREIRRLEHIREKLLDDAPNHFYFRRLLLPIMLVMILIPIAHNIWTGHFDSWIGGIACRISFLSCVAALGGCGRALWLWAIGGDFPTDLGTRAIAHGIFKRK